MREIDEGGKGRNNAARVDKEGMRETGADEMGKVREEGGAVLKERGAAPVGVNNERGEGVVLHYPSFRHS